MPGRSSSSLLRSSIRNTNGCPVHKSAWKTLLHRGLKMGLS